MAASVKRGVAIEVSVGWDGDKKALTDVNKYLQSLQAAAGNIKLGFDSPHGYAHPAGPSGNGRGISPGEQQASALKKQEADAKKLADFMEKTTRKQLEREQKEQDAIVKERQKQAAAEEKAKQKSVSDAEKAAKKQADAQIKEAARAAKEQAKSLADAEKDRQKAVEAAERAAKKQADAEAREAKRAADAREKEAKRAADAEAKARAAAARDDEVWKAAGFGSGGAIGHRTGTAGMSVPSRSDIADPMGLGQYGQAIAKDRARQQREEAESTARLREQYSRLGESIVGSVDAVTHLGEGLAYLGLVGEEDLKGLTDSLLKIRGTADAIRGGVQSLRDIGGLVRNLKDVRGMAGLTGVARSFVGLGPAAGVGAAGTGAAGGGTAAAGTAAGAGIVTTIGAAAAALAGLAAAAVSAKQTFGDARKYGFMGGAEHGSWRDRWAGKVAGAGSGIVGAELSIARLFGATEKGQERFLHSGKARYLDPTGHAEAFGQLALAERKTARMTSQFEKERAARREHDEQQAGVLQEKYAGYEGAYQKGNEERAFRLQMTASGNPLQDSQARLKALQEQQAGAEQLKQQYVAARGTIIGPQGENEGSQRAKENADAIKEAEKEIKRLKEDELLLTREIQKEAITGLEKQLSLQKQEVAAKQGEYQAAARLRPAELRALKQIQDKVKAGKELSETELRIAERSGVRAIEQSAGRQRKRQGREALEQAGIDTAYNPDADFDEGAPEVRDLRKQEQAVKDARRNAGQAEPEGERYDAARQERLLREANGTAQREQAQGAEPSSPVRPPSAGRMANEIPPAGPMPRPQQQAGAPLRVEPIEFVASVKHEVIARIAGGAEVERDIAAAMAFETVELFNRNSDVLAQRCAKEAAHLVNDAIRRQNTQGRQLS